MSMLVMIQLRVRTTSKEGTVVCFESIKRTDEDRTYRMPRALATPKLHAEPFQLPTVKNSIKNLTKAGQYRNIRVTLPEKLMPKYVDTDGNFVFNEEYLDEIDELVAGPTASTVDDSGQKAFSTIAKENLRNVEGKFLIEKFNGRQKASDWLASFESECTRHSITEDREKVDCLRFFV